MQGEVLERHLVISFRPLSQSSAPVTRSQPQGMLTLPMQFIGPVRNGLAASR